MRHYKTTEIMLYWSEELSEKKQEEVENHLKTCNECRKIFTDLEILEKEVQALPLVTPGKDLVNIIFETPAQEKERRRWFSAPALQFAIAAVVVCILGVLYFLPTPTDQFPRVHAEFEVVLEARILQVSERLNRLEQQIRGKREKNLRRMRPSDIEQKFLIVRSDVKKLKRRIVESGSFPFHNTFTKQRRKQYEDKKTLHQHNTFDYYVLSHFGSGLC